MIDAGGFVSWEVLLVELALGVGAVPVKAGLVWLGTVPLPILLAHLGVKAVQRIDPRTYALRPPRPRTYEDGPWEIMLIVFFLVLSVCYGVMLAVLIPLTGGASVP